MVVQINFMFLQPKRCMFIHNVTFLLQLIIELNIYFVATLQEYKISSIFNQGTNVLGLVMFSVILGATIGKLGEKGKPLQAVFSSMSEAMMIITSWVIWLEYSKDFQDGSQISVSFINSQVVPNRCVLPCGC